MNRNRERSIADLAEKISDKYSKTIRVNPELIALREGLTFSDGQYGDHFEAMIEFCSSDPDYPFHIYLNNDQIRHPASLRGRSSFGHELGHYFIPEHRKILLAGESLTYDRNHNYIENPTVENEANCFSANLLMPPTIFREQADKHKELGLNSVLRLSHRFDTSMLSTALQYVKMDLYPTVLVKWTADNRFHWRYMSNKFRKSVPDSYKFQFNAQRPTSDYDLTKLSLGSWESTYGTTITNLSSWVYDIKPGSRKDMVLREQTMPLGKYGGISLLSPAS
ncbi:MAG: ImmA/IrrE family metallo-endopeptidase [Bacteroidia bacterium]|nr:ImmA/IrrE family metallo-endopeptidase [Bacteroidia bacterium]